MSPSWAGLAPWLTRIGRFPNYATNLLRFKSNNLFANHTSPPPILYTYTERERDIEFTVNWGGTWLLASATKNGNQSSNPFLGIVKKFWAFVFVRVGGRWVAIGRSFRSWEPNGKEEKETK